MRVRYLVALLAAVVLAALPAAAQEAAVQAAAAATPAQIQQAVSGMTPAQIQQAAQAHGITPSQAQQALQGMAPEAIQQLQQAAPAGLVEQLMGQAPGATAAPETAGETTTGSTTESASETTATAAVHAREKTASSLEAIYRTSYATPLARGLSQFGYEIFATGRTQPSRLAVPDPDYILGPGDKLRIRVWGADIDAEFTGAIERTGGINVPKIGVVPLAGARFGDAEDIIRREAEKYVQGINIRVTLAELRSLEIYVVGEVKAPGLHMVAPFSTILGGLVDAGGVKKSGSLRNIQLYRHGKLATTLDLYDLLLKGDKSADLLLTDRDIIFVPRIGATAAVAGAVAQPGIYELKNEKNLAQLLALAGGDLPQSFTGRVYLRRYAGNQEFVVQDIDTTREHVAFTQVPVQNGDLVELQFLAAVWPETVQLEGHVWFPDVFKWRPNLKLSEILTGPQLLKPDAVTEFAYLFRYDPVSTLYSMESIPLAEVFAGSYDTVLQPHDRVRILSRQELGIREPIRVQGAVYKPGEFPYRPGLTLGDALALAGGLRFGADSARVDVSRQQVDDGELTTTHFIKNAASDQDFPLQPYDYVMVREVKEARDFKQVEIAGEVRFPGTYRIRKGERLADLIERAGGFTEDAYFYGAQYFSSSARLIQQKSLDQLIDDLEVRAETVLADTLQTTSGQDTATIAAGQSALRRLVERLRKIKASGRVAIQLADLASLRDSANNIVLEDGDRLVIPKRPEFVSVVGSVYTPNSFLFRPELTIADYLAKAGGPTRDAEEKYIYLLKANGEVVARDQSGFLRNDFDDLRPMPGDTIVVPEKLERIPYLMVTRDIADILFKIATTAGVALSL